MATGHRPSLVLGLFRHGRDRVLAPAIAHGVLADLIEAFSDRFLREHWSWWQRPLAALDGISAPNPPAPRSEWRLSFVDRAPARAARAKVLGWDCERVIMAHGEERSSGHAYLERSLAGSVLRPQQAAWQPFSLTSATRRARAP